MCPCSIQRTLVPNRATRNSNTRQVVTLRTQTWAQKNLKNSSYVFEPKAKVELDA